MTQGPKRKERGGGYRGKWQTREQKMRIAGQVLLRLTRGVDQKKERPELSLVRVTGAYPPTGGTSGEQGLQSDDKCKNRKNRKV
jgi:hypothetical protein